MYICSKNLMENPMEKHTSLFHPYARPMLALCPPYNIPIP